MPSMLKRYPHLPANDEARTIARSNVARGNVYAQSDAFRKPSAEDRNRAAAIDTAAELAAAKKARKHK